MKKVTIHNNRKDYDSRFMRPMQSVPNADCEEAIRIRKHDYALRAAFESTKFSKGVFLLFSYAPLTVPTVTYKDMTCMCFNNEHIQVLLKAIKDKYSTQNVSWLIGSEYGVDKAHTQRPHYHAFFLLSDSVDADEFTEFCRTIWTGKSYGRRNQPWRFGNLGFMFPSKKDCTLKKHIVKNLQSAATYTAKYAVKQVGFYNKPAIQAIIDDGARSLYRNSMPRVFTSQHFGACMEKDPSFNIVDGTVRNPITKQTTSIPSYNKSRVMVSRWFDGDFRIKMETVRCCVVRKDGTHHNCFVKSPVLDNNGLPKLRRNYRSSLTVDAVAVRIKQLPLWISKYQCNIAQTFNLNMGLAYRCAVYHYVYKNLPIHCFTNFIDKYGDDTFSMWSYNCYMRVYKLTSLFRGLRFNDFLSFYERSDNDSYYHRSHCSMAAVIPENVVMLEQQYTDLLESSAEEIESQRSKKEQLCSKLLQFIKPEKIDEKYFGDSE